MNRHGPPNVRKRPVAGRFAEYFNRDQDRPRYSSAVIRSQEFSQGFRPVGQILDETVIRIAIRAIRRSLEKSDHENARRIAIMAGLAPAISALMERAA